MIQKFFSNQVRKAIDAVRSDPAAKMIYSATEPLLDFGTGYAAGGRRVGPEDAKTVATAYRCGNIISDDISVMPLQLFEKQGRNKVRIEPDAITRNMAYLVEISPNRWMTPQIFKKTVIDWVTWWGNGYIWDPPGPWPELFILDADRTFPVFDAEGNLWYQTIFPNGVTEYLPAVEILHLMINPVRGLYGRGVITYARETIGRQIGSNETRDRISATGFNPAATLTVSSALNREARTKIRDQYIEGIEAGGILILDNKISKFEPVTMRPADAQFLENSELTETEICNFFGMPLFKLNRGKESYESNEQQDLHYLRSTLNPYLVQWEQSARRRWLTEAEQTSRFWRFERGSLLWMDSKTRSEVVKNRVLAGMLEINEGREIEDLPMHPHGDVLLIPSNMNVMDRDGQIVQVAKPAQTPTPNEQDGQNA